MDVGLFWSLRVVGYYYSDVVVVLLLVLVS